MNEKYIHPELVLGERNRKRVEKVEVGWSVSKKRATSRKKTKKEIEIEISSEEEEEEEEIEVEDDNKENLLISTQEVGEGRNSNNDDDGGGGGEVVCFDEEKKSEEEERKEVNLLPKTSFDPTLYVNHILPLISSLQASCDGEMAISDMRGRVRAAVLSSMNQDQDKEGAEEVVGQMMDKLEHTNIIMVDEEEDLIYFI